MEAVVGWSTLVCNTGGTFAVKTSSYDNQHNLAVSLTDLANLWFENVNADQILKRCQVVNFYISFKLQFFFNNFFACFQELNPFVETEVDKLILQLCQLLQPTSSGKDAKIDIISTEIDFTNEMAVLKMKAKLTPSSPIFTWVFHLEKQSSHQVSFN